jgi:hypothetical protein
MLIKFCICSYHNQQQNCCRVLNITIKSIYLNYKVDTPKKNLG